eukprot:5256871-Karenia_brevis.AAC.1
MEVYIGKMRAALSRNLLSRDRGDCTLPNAARSPEQFLADMHREPIKVSSLKDAYKTHLRDSHAPLFASFPTQTKEKMTLAML